MERLQWRGIRAIASSFLLLANSAAWADDTPPNSGLIHFTGEIVAAPYEITSPARSSAGDTGHWRHGAAGQLVFEQRSVDRPSACIRVRPVLEEAIDLAFVDRQGRRQVMQPGQAHCIGRDGGTLSVASPTADGRRAALVTVAYH